MRSVLESELDTLDLNGSQRNVKGKRKSAIEEIQLDGGLEEVIRVPQSLLNSNLNSEFVPGESIIGGNTGNQGSTNMSMFASVMLSTDDENKLRKSQIPKQRQLGLAEAKRSLIQKNFFLGDHMDSSNLDEMVIRGSNVLENEIKAA